jgi:hypothetical protein
MQDAPSEKKPLVKPLTNRERYFKWRYEQAAEAFRNRDLDTVQDIAAELLLRRELPLFYRAALSFYLVGRAISHDIRTSKAVSIPRHKLARRATDRA